MRFWHPSLIPYLPRQQLLSQWREGIVALKESPNHILIEWLYEYSDEEGHYTAISEYMGLIYNTMKKRGYKPNYDLIKDLPRFSDEWFDKRYADDYLCELFDGGNYLKICCWNLYEKYMRGQVGFTDEAKKFIKGHTINL